MKRPFDDDDDEAGEELNTSPGMCQNLIICI
jgi:hypothetical protein